MLITLRHDAGADTWQWIVYPDADAVAPLEEGPRYLTREQAAASARARAALSPGITRWAGI